MDTLAARALSTAEALGLALPPRASLFLATVAGRVWWMLDGRRRVRARSNLAAVFPQQDARTRERLVRNVFTSMARTPIESLFLPRLLGSRRQLDARASKEGDWELLLADIAAGRGGVIVGAHLGAWETGTYVLRALGAQVSVVARPLDRAAVDAVATRRRGGSAAVIRHHGALAGMRKALGRGRWVALLADQNAGPQGHFVPFFGMPASTQALPLRIAQMEGVPVYVGATLRAGAPFRFRLFVKRLEIPLPDPDRAHLDAAMRAYHTALEEWIGKAPDQYNWLHRRWRSRPPGEAPDLLLPRYDKHRPAEGASPARARADAASDR